MDETKVSSDEISEAIQDCYRFLAAAEIALAHGDTRKAVEAFDETSRIIDSIVGSFA